LQDLIDSVFNSAGDILPAPGTIRSMTYLGIDVLHLIVLLYLVLCTWN